VIEVRVDDLGFFEGEAIVRPANAMLGATTPVMRRLEQAAGSSFAQHTHINQPLPVGAAVVTRAGELGVEFVIHGIVSSDTEPVTRTSVRMALTNALHRAASFQIGQVAIAPFGLGAGNLDIEDSADVMVDVLREHLQRFSYPSSVLIIVETELEEEVILTRLRSRAE